MRSGRLLLFLFLFLLLLDLDYVVRLWLHGLHWLSDQLHILINENWHALKDWLRRHMEHC